ncbi:MAG: Maf family protein [Gemmatimonadetes bacterium]|nr:Maf family protein [Gemmatimonadota bacterium]MDA1104199.1 Maf family protein [Gemmatimonadota bacterium]
MIPELILASASPRRVDVLRQLGFDPTVQAADVDESYLEGESASEHVERLARRKAETVYTGGDVLVIGGDTVVVDGTRIVSKPKSASDAVAMLLSLAGRSHDVLSGLAIAGPHGVVSSVTRTSVYMRDFDAATATAYVATGEPLDKAGGYGIQGLGAALVERIEGDYYSVVGFPVGAFLDLLERAGWQGAFGTLTRGQVD